MSTDNELTSNSKQWRFVMGVGIGAEYPLSAVITSEWSSTSSRATMISSVFMMQPVGQALAQLVGLWVVIGQNNRYDLQGMQCGINDKYEHECKQIIDGIWRIVIGSGCVPALLAIIFRFFLYDCGLYSLEVKAKPGTAFRDTQRVYGAPPPAVNVDSPYSPGGYQAQPFQFMPIQFSREDLYHYFITDGNWYYLLGTSATWFFLDGKCLTVTSPTLNMSGESPHASGYVASLPSCLATECLGAKFVGGC